MTPEEQRGYDRGRFESQVLGQLQEIKNRVITVEDAQKEHRLYLGKEVENNIDRWEALHGRIQRMEDHNGMNGRRNTKILGVRAGDAAAGTGLIGIISGVVLLVLQRL